MLELAQRMVLCALVCSIYARASCPPGCECSEAAHTVKCVSKELQTIPKGIPGYTRNLFITGNNISRIGPTCFQGLDNVTNLSLSNNRITEVESNTFADLRALRYLDLSSNQLTAIHPEGFSMHNHTLRELNLSRALYNHSAVTDLAAALRQASLGSLQGLDLSGNGLVLLPPRTFSRLGQLRRLQLSNNSLVAIHNATFWGLQRLEELDLTFNALKGVPEEGLRELDALPAASGLLLGDNPFDCTCAIEPLALWLNRSRGRVRDAEAPSCASPATMRNVTLLAAAALTLRCYQRAAGADLALQTSYVFLGLVLGLVGLVFLFVLYLNRKGIKKRVNEARDACREVWEGYHYRYEIDSDPRLSQVSSNADA
ncbi:trophoblast glycoprotein a [Gadus chalcogrammus]|uniref:trophoblast glycoprotein a n=1 Tax=Gadus chalcogrammus TaxID=1042646 RepID=UPI0024C47932|nr:trophoblast glycoprotein a [Gadus chalcogrammus]